MTTRTCQTCMFVTQKLITDSRGIGRYAEICKRAGVSTAFERSGEGDQYCGVEAKFWEEKP